MRLLNYVLSIYRFLLCYLVSKIYSLYRIDNTKIILWSFDGSTFSCNPKYITKYILDNKKNYKIVWGFKNPNKFKYLENNGIKIVKQYSKEFFYELMTSKFIITNARFTRPFYKRKKQVYIQTWHGTMAIKTIERDAETNLSKSYLRSAKRDSKKIDYLISGCKENSDIFRRAFWYNGPILEYGNPRNDIFFKQDECKKKIEEKYSIKHKTIILYAPTFRNSGNTKCYDIAYSNLIRTINKRFNCDSIVLTRLHPNLKGKKMFNKVSTSVIDVTDYDDMQELLSAADILITDFSSSVFDLLIMKKICFLYASDYFDYIAKERKLYFNIKEELIRNIQLFDNDKYNKKLEEFCNRLNFYEDGHASERVLNLIEKLAGEEKQ